MVAAEANSSVPFFSRERMYEQTDFNSRQESNDEFAGNAI